MTSPCKLPPERKPIPTLGDILTIWSPGLSLTDAWAHPRVQGLIAQVRPAGVQLHGSWSHLIQHAPRVTELARKDGLAVWWGLGADGDKRTARDRWPKVAVEAHASGAAALVVNAEAGWTVRDHGAEVSEAMAECRAIIPTGHTSYCVTTWFPDYPWSEFLDNSDWTIPQVYREGGSYAGTMSRYHEGLRSYEPYGCPALPYLACAWDKAPPSVAGNVAVALRSDTVCWWTIPASLGDYAGRVSVLATALLRRMGYVGPEAVQGYQRAAGLDADGECGPRTLRSLALID